MLYFVIIFISMATGWIIGMYNCNKKWRPLKSEQRRKVIERDNTYVVLRGTDFTELCHKAGTLQTGGING